MKKNQIRHQHVLYLTIILLIFSILPAFAQFQMNTLHVPGLKWKQLESEHFTIYFPKELEDEAERVANILEHVYGPIGKTMRTKPDRFPLILTNTGSIANGYVRTAPKLSLWYHLPTIEYSFGPGEWYTLLSTHETRHMVQFNRMDTGFTKFAGFLYGQTGSAILTALSIPLWLEEGDAVTTETALTDFGRGRQPWFYRDLKALLLEGEKPSYYDAAISSMYGSYKKHFPNHYHLGFILVTYLRDKYDAEIWERIIDRTMRFSFMPLMFNIAIKRETGKTLSKIYHDTMSEITSFWKQQQKNLNITPATNIKPVTSENNIHRDNWTNYIWPQPAEDSSIIALKYGLDDSFKIVKLIPLQPGQSNIQAREIFITNANPLDNTISYARKKIVWSEKFSDPVWSARQWADIVMYDLAIKTKVRLTKNKHFFVPTLSPDGSKIAAVEFTAKRQSSIVIVSTATGKIISRFQNKTKNADGEIFGKPSWSANGLFITFVIKSAQGNSLVILDTRSGNIKYLVKAVKRDIANPVFYRDFIIFQAPYNGKDNLFALNYKTPNNKILKITERPYGAYQPAVTTNKVSLNCKKNIKKLYFSDYSVGGFTVSYMNKSEIIKNAKTLNLQSFLSRDNDNLIFPYLEKIVRQEQGKSITNTGEIPRKNYKTADYNPFLHPFNFHSWGIIPTTTNELSAFAISNDIFGNFNLIPMISFNFLQGTFGGEISGTFSGTFPNIGFTERLYQLDSKTDFLESTQLALIFPVDISRFSWNRKLTFLTGIGHSGIISTMPDFQISSNIYPLQFSLGFTNTIARAKRDLYPLWGQELYTSVLTTPLANATGTYQPGKAFQFFGGFRTFFPGFFTKGFFSHNSLRLTGSYFYGFSNYYSLGYPGNNSITSLNPLYPRGYQNIDYNDMVRFSLDYSFPILYPDLALGPFIFFSRIRGNFFYDAGLKSQGVRELFSFSNASFKWQNLYSYSYMSVGFELKSEFMLFTLPSPISLGARFIYRITDNNFRIEDTLLSLGFNF